MTDRRRCPAGDVTDLHESLTPRSFVDAMERSTADVDRLEAAFDEHGVRAVEPRAVAAADGAAADAVIGGYNDVSATPTRCSTPASTRR